MIISGTTITGGVLTDAPEPFLGLYSFSTFIFTTANTIGRFGPNLSTLTSWYNSNSSYSGNTWISDTNYFDQIQLGYQLWTVPATGTYTITVAGARAGARAGGNVSITPGYGQGAIIRSSNISLVQGQKLQIVCGQEGLSYTTNGSGGGGGGSYVAEYLANLAATSSANIIMVAGGGGNMNQIGANAAVYASSYFTANSNANIAGFNGNRGTPTSAAGTNGSGAGTNGLGGGTVSWGGGGGGFSGNGASGAQPNGGGIAFRFGANGGLSAYTNTSILGGASLGGFGGGGGTHGYTGGGGGGGGYSGGGGGQQNNLWDMAGGGGSYSKMAGYEQVGYNRGPGYVIITKN